jgi:hypothetical protein
MLKTALRPLVRQLHRCWLWLLGPPDYRRIPGLGELGAMQPRVRFDLARAPVTGWLTLAERRALYSIARWSPGPFLEIGSWLGLSTTIIALGIADSGDSKEFDTCEFNPTLANFRPTANGQIGFFIPADSSQAMGLCSCEVFENEIKPVVGHPDGVGGLLQKNLARAGVSALVRVSLGDFRHLDARTYRCVFCDALHDETEIRRNAPELRRFLAPGAILACHDTTAVNEQLLREYFAFGDAFRADSLFVGHISPR